MISRSSSVLLAVVVSLALGSSVRGQATCQGDFNGDGLVDSLDLAGVLAAWGPCEATIGSLSPAEGTVLGGTTITLTGTNLGQSSVVMVGGNPCTALTIVSANEIRATTPAGSPGPADVVVTTPAGNVAALVPFTYRSQSVASIKPASGPYSGGTPITITGQYLGGTTSVTIGGVPATEVTILDSTTVTARTPPGSVGPQVVVVTGVKGTLVIPSGFTFFVSPLVPSWATLVEAFPDPAVVTDAALREAIAATGYAWRVRDSGTEIEMLLIPPGTFTMGCSAAVQFGCDADEYPTHPVTLTNAFYLGRYEVTQAQWTAVMGSNPSFFQGPDHPNSESRPVEQVSWNMVQQFNTATGFRLPTEAQWEHACRAGTTTAVHSFAGYPNGTNDDWLAVFVAWCGTWDCLSGFPQNCQTRQVGLKQANSFGLHDMLGNVWEATADWYSATYYQTSPPINPQGPPSGQFRVRRGGSFVEVYGSGSRSSSRDTLFPPNGATYSAGFRVARDP